MGGKKKGGSSHTPVEAKETGRSFQILRMLEVISEGEIEGLVDDMKSVYLDKTPLANADGSFNFKNVSVYANAGTQDQDVLREFNSVEKEINVGTKVLKNKPIIKTVTDVNVNRVRMTLGVERLMKQEDNGDTNPTSVSMLVEVLKDNSVVGSRTYTFNGKYSNTYREMFDMTVPNAPFSIRVSRVEPDSSTNKLQNNCFWASYTEIIDKQFAYPNTALVGIKIDSDYFGNIPTRNYEINGLIIKVPSNYNPETHTYTSDFWDGSFKLAWTNNPAWVFYDLVTNTRYGMGKRLQDFNIDKWQLYAIGRYCDELVPDGFGGKEPRMTCNIWITDQRKAYDLINDICSIFRAMPVWNGQALTAIQDRKADPVWTYNNANTIGGFTRQRSARKARHNTIQVEYIDASDFYEKKVESVSDDVAVARYGENVKKITAFGCTSRGQAYRTGRWILETERLETETITFTVGQEGVMHLPYDVIEVADSQYAGVNVGGRVLAVNGTQLKLDRSIEIDNNSYLSYVSANGYTENVKIVSFDKKTNIATVGKNLDGIPELTVWGLSTKRITTGLYRAISIKENDNADGKTYTITALQHVPEKEDIVVNGTHFDPKPQTIYGDVVDAEINYNGRSLTINGKVNGSFNVLSSNNIASYTVKLLKDGALIYIEKGLKTPDIKLDDLENGTYEAHILAYNDKNQLLNQYIKTFKIDRPPVVANASAVGGLGCIYLTWDYVDDITDTEIWASKTNDLSTARRITKLNGLMYTFECEGNETWYFWLRHVRGVNVGSFGQTTGIRATSADSLDDIKQLQAKIVNEVITTALPARKLDMTLTVDNIGNPAQYRGHKQVYNEADGKLYTWNGSKYESGAKELLASAIRGKISPDQLAEIPSSKITGQLQANQITGALSIAQIPNIPTSKLSGTIGANLFQANSIGANIIQTGAIGANHLQANSVGATQLQANSVGANAIQANAIGADKIQANSINSAKLQVGAIRSEHIATDQITADKLAIGVGGNILPNPLFKGNSDGWYGFVWYNEPIRQYWTAGSVGVQYENLRYNVNQAYRPHDSKYTDETFSFAKWSVADYQRLANDSKNNKLWVDNARVLANVIAGKTYIFSAYVGCHHCGGYLIAEEYSSDGRNFVRWLANTELFGERDRIHLNNGENCIEASSSHFANGVDTKNAHRAFVKFTAPQSGVVCLIFRIHRFGYKQAYQDCYMARAMLEEVKSDQDRPSEWKETAVTSIHGSSILTGTVHADKIVAGSITGDKIAGNTISGDKLVARSITTDKLNVNALSAISSNIGTINAGSITGTNISGNNINGNNINGNNISGGTISGTTIRGVTIEASTIRGTNIEGVTVRAENIIGDVVKGYQLRVDGGRRMNYDRKYNAVGLFNSFNIPRSSRNRILVLTPLLLDHITGEGEQNRPNGHIGKIRVNNVEQHCEYLVFSNRIFGGIMTSSIWLNANTDFEITCSIENTIGYSNSIYPTSKIFNFMLINA